MKWDQLGLFWTEMPAYKLREYQYPKPSDSPWRAGHEFEQAVCPQFDTFPVILEQLDVTMLIYNVRPLAPFDQCGMPQKGLRFFYQAIAPVCIEGATWHEDVVPECPTCDEDEAFNRLGEIANMVLHVRETGILPSLRDLIGRPFAATMIPV